MPRARAVIGASFGDEGKGLMVDYLCSQGADVVVRFNGGAQAGHTVVTPDGRRHVFHHFGSGSFLGVSTYLSEYFVCNPILFAQELAELRALNVSPDVCAHPDCLVTTFADMFINQALESRRAGNRHGSCGVGFHETQNRSKVSRLKITLGDLWNGSRRLAAQLEEICTTYATFRTGAPIAGWEGLADTFLGQCQDFVNRVRRAGMAGPAGMAGRWWSPVFEGAQGLLLDQDNREFFPHVTHSHTGIRNVRALCARGGFDEIEAWYVSRTYLTRHGAGPLPGHDPSLSFVDETNAPNEFQGTMRFAPLDQAALRHRCRDDFGGPGWKLALTHRDQLDITASGLRGNAESQGPTRDDVIEYHHVSGTVTTSGTPLPPAPVPAAPANAGHRRFDLTT